MSFCLSFKCKNKVFCNNCDVSDPRSTFCKLHYTCFASNVDNVKYRCSFERKYILKDSKFSMFCNQHTSSGFDTYYDEMYKLKDSTKCRYLQHCNNNETLAKCQEKHRKILDCRDTTFRIFSLIFPGVRDKTHEQFMKLWVYNKKGIESYKNGYPYMLHECNKVCPFDKETKRKIRKEFKKKKSSIRKRVMYITTNSR